MMLEAAWIWAALPRGQGPSNALHDQTQISTHTADSDNVHAKPALTVRFGRFAGLTAIPEIGIASRITRPPDVNAFH